MKVGLVYDPIYLEHDTGRHVENASRLVEIKRHLTEVNLMEELIALPPRPASEGELLLVHSPQHISQIKRVAQGGGGWLDADTVMSPASHEVALYAVGGVIKAVEAVVNGEVDSAFALVRPPGHHATYHHAMGFCLFNNIAIAAKYALKILNLNRILIVDFDVHHGNGTQEAFYNDPQVLYFSTHQYPFYPGSGSIEESGAGDGEGTTVNVPLPAWCGDEEYLRVFEEILVPLSWRFQPQLIMVSAGYDPHWADQISQMQLSVTGFVQLARILKGLATELCMGHLVFTLEGGYHLEALASAVRATLEVLLGREEIVDPLGRSPLGRKASDIKDVIRQVKRVHSLD